MMLPKSGNNPVHALHCLLQGAKMLRRSELRGFVLIPLLINLLLYSLAFALGYYTVAGLIEQFIPAWLHWLDWLLWPLFFLSFMLMGFFSFTLLANLLAAPFYDRLAARTLILIGGEAAGASAEQPWRQVLSGELGRLKYLLWRGLPLLVLFAIPGVNLLAPLLWALFAAWGIAMEYLAYPLEARGLDFAAQQAFLRRNRLGVLSLGGAVGFGLTLPVVNLLITQAAVVGATLFVDGVAGADNPWRPAADGQTD